MKTIPLTKGYFCTVDDEDFEWLSKYKWFASGRDGNMYARRDYRRNNKLYFVFMHREILGITDKTIHIDHIDGNGLNNSKINIRTCNRSENMLNRKSKENSQSKYVGVGFDHRKKTGNWRWYIHVNGKLKMKYGYANEYDAALARDLFILDNNMLFPKLNILSR